MLREPDRQAIAQHAELQRGLRPDVGHREDERPAVAPRQPLTGEGIEERREWLGKDRVWLSRGLRPLLVVVGDASQPSLFGSNAGFEDDACESGYCVTKRWRRTWAIR